MTFRYQIWEISSVTGIFPLDLFLCEYMVQRKEIMQIGGLFDHFDTFA